MFESQMITMIIDNMGISIYMVVASTFFSYLFGLPLGVLLIVTASDGLHPMPLLNQVLNVLVNLLRSVPFLILLFMIMPFTQFVTGSSFGRQCHHCATDCQCSTFCGATDRIFFQRN